MTAYENTDKEIWRKIEGEYYSPRIFVTKEGSIGIDVGGYVYVQSVEEWHKQADRIAELEETINACYTAQKMQAEEVYKGNDRIAELEFENKAFRKELFNIGSMRSCSYAAQHHGFVSPRQAGDDAREYIAEILEKAKGETK